MASYKGTAYEGKRGGRSRGTTGRDDTVILTNDSTSALIWVPVQGVDVVADVQTVTPTDSPDGGTFTLATAGDVTGTIAYNAAKSVVETAIETLDEYTAATVTGSDGGPWIITSADGAGLPGETLVVDDTLTENGTIVNVHTTVGVANVFEVVSFWVDGDTGTFTLTYGGQETGTIAAGAASTLIDTRLTALSSIADVAVSGAGTKASPYVVTFADPAGAATAMTSDTTLLTKTVIAAARAS